MTTAQVHIRTTTVVTTWEDLITAAEGSPDGARIERIIIAGDLTADEPILITRPIILTAGAAVTITRDSGFTDTLFEVTGELHLGEDGMEGTLTIDGNNVSGSDSLVYINGGGVFVGTVGAFSKTGGVIYGSDATEADKNTADNNQGHAVYCSADTKQRNNTAGSGVNLSTDSASPDYAKWE
jgi:hypothetical protein